MPKCKRKERNYFEVEEEEEEEEREKEEMDASVEG